MFTKLNYKYESNAISAIILKLYYGLAQISQKLGFINVCRINAFVGAYGGLSTVILGK